MSLINEPLPTPLGPPLAMPVSPGTAPTPDDVIAFAREHDVHLVDLKFTDLPGTWQHFAVASRELGEFEAKTWINAIVQAIRAVKADQESLRLQNEFYERSKQPLNTPQL